MPNSSVAFDTKSGTARNPAATSSILSVNSHGALSPEAQSVVSQGKLSRTTSGDVPTRLTFSADLERL